MSTEQSDPIEPNAFEIVGKNAVQYGVTPKAGVVKRCTAMGLAADQHDVVAGKSVGMSSAMPYSPMQG
ncbi:hypothetical protein [Mesorhizobium sp. M0684]|uniref:hypothetical protein n=1 Tax=Mesorhizobium sp. M0684 TaxID=2956986 RepID=UPI0033393F88